ncbi:MAG TPA: IPT/TIG domain-containing protein [Thermoanaerobaculia bacterium]|nr:IPT/TIG domain-containing protein [Thermoanaerobaculia bacterium]
MRKLFGLLILFATTASAAPVITSISPTEGTEHGGTTILIRGIGFKSSAEVFIDGARPAAQSWLPLTQELEALTLPHAPGKVTLTVRQDDGEVTLQDAFTYLEDPYHMSPSSGPRTGGTLVTIKGEFAPTGYTVLFGDRPALGTWRISNDTLLAVSPPQSGVLDSVPIKLFEYDFGVATNLVFTYVDAPERVLLPLLTEPVNGAFGARFVTELRAFNRSSTQDARISGLSRSCCLPVVPDPTRDSIDVQRNSPLAPADIAYNGTPGRFVFVPTNQADRLWLNLRVYDSTRSTQNFGTELPVVRDRELFRNEPIVFTDVPADPRFRNTLRIYADAAVKVQLQLARDAVDFIEVREIDIPAPKNKFDPSYVQIGDLPANAGPLRITITPPQPGQPGFYTALWAFISVTNNDTQLITTIRP